MNKKLDVELTSLSDDELLELYNNIEKHRIYLEESIINLEEEKEKSKEEKKNESSS